MDETRMDKKIIVYIIHVKAKHRIVFVNFHMGTL